MAGSSELVGRVVDGDGAVVAAVKDRLAAREEDERKLKRRSWMRGEASREGIELGEETLSYASSTYFLSVMLRRRKLMFGRTNDGNVDLLCGWHCIEFIIRLL